MTNEQQAWLFKIESEIRAAFPGDPLADEAQMKKLLEAVAVYLKKAKENEDVKRWLLNILHDFQNRHLILIREEGTDREKRNELYKENKELNKRVEEWIKKNGKEN